jgi:hypothetical protein
VGATEEQLGTRGNPAEHVNDTLHEPRMREPAFLVESASGLGGGSCMTRDVMRLTHRGSSSCTRMMLSRAVCLKTRSCCSTRSDGLCSVVSRCTQLKIPCSRANIRRYTACNVFLTYLLHCTADILQMHSARCRRESRKSHAQTFSHMEGETQIACTNIQPHGGRDANRMHKHSATWCTYMGVQI